MSFIPLPPSQSIVIRERLNRALGEQRPERFLDLRFGLKHDHKIDNNIDIEQWSVIESLLCEYAMFASASAIGFGAKPENLRWAFAYPATFFASEKKKFDTLCKAATTLAGRSPFTQAPSKDDFAVTLPPLMVVEPLAVHMHFRNHPRTRTDGIMITVDVGGHSTDISISSRGKLVWYGSLAIAGQHVFTDYLIFNPEALRLFTDLETVAAYLKECCTLRSMALDNMDEALMVLREFVDAILSENKSEINLKDNKDIRGKSAIRLFLLGLMEYIRLILERCHQCGFVDDGLPVALYFAGGGARLFFDWVGEKACQRIFENTLESLPWSGQAASLFYDRNYAKMEVAEGLLAVLGDVQPHAQWVDYDRILDWSPLPLGEKVQLGMGIELNYLDIIPTRNFGNPRSIRLDSIDRFKEFLERAKFHGVDIGKLNMKALYDRTCNAFEKEKRRGVRMRMTKVEEEFDETTLIQLQPPFILALRACIEMMVRGA